MRVLSLTLLYGLLSFFSSTPVLEFPTSGASTLKSNVADASITKSPRAINLLFQSTDGGQTWQDVSSSLPEIERPEGFFAGTSDVYMRLKNVLYRSKSNSGNPVWEKDASVDPRIASIAFNRSGVTAYNYEGQIYQKSAASSTWAPVYTRFKQQEVETVFEIADGSILIGCRSGLYKSADKGQSWKKVKSEGWVMDIAESNGVLIATGEKGIMRSADNGEQWEWVIKEGGVGIDVENIDGGFAAITYNNASKARRVRISTDGGKTWEAIDENLRASLSISSIKQAGSALVLGHPDGIYRSADRGKTWNLVHHGLDGELQFGGILNNTSDRRKVFRIYTSGNVLYAVANNIGC